jgi:hypothetical protein
LKYMDGKIGRTLTSKSIHRSTYAGGYVCGMPVALEHIIFVGPRQQSIIRNDQKVMQM